MADERTLSKGGGDEILGIGASAPNSRFILGCAMINSDSCALFLMSSMANGRKISANAVGSGSVVYSTAESLSRSCSNALIWE